MLSRAGFEQSQDDADAMPFPDLQLEEPVRTTLAERLAASNRLIAAWPPIETPAAAAAGADGGERLEAERNQQERDFDDLDTQQFLEEVVTAAHACAQVLEAESHQQQRGTSTETRAATDCADEGARLGDHTPVQFGALSPFTCFDSSEDEARRGVKRNQQHLGDNDPLEKAAEAKIPNKKD